MACCLTTHNYFQEFAGILARNAENERFGISVAVSENTMAIGASYRPEDYYLYNCVYLFRRNEEGKWLEINVLGKRDGRDKYGVVPIGLSNATLVFGGFKT